MMSKKAARLYGRMQHGITKKQEVVAELQRKRKQIQVAKDNKGKHDGGNIVPRKEVVSESLIESKKAKVTKDNKAKADQRKKIEQQVAAVEELQRKRKDLQYDKKNKGKTVDGKTILKAKVDRLKDERKTIEKEYENAASSGSMKKKKRKTR